MKKWLIGLLLIGILALTPAVGAQASLSFATVQIQFWPEYDRPEMLVIFTYELPDEQSLPVEMSVRIPGRVSSPTAVAVLEGSQLVTREFTLATEGDWTVVTLTTDSPVVQIEYYDPALNQTGQSRDFLFEWFSDYQVGELIVAFKQPVHATETVFSASLGIPEAGADGLDYYAASFGGLSAGEDFSFSIQYQKSDDLLSADVLAQGSGQTDSGTAQPAAQSQLPVWGWYVIGAGALILAGGGMYLWYLNTPTAFSKYRQKKARSSSRSGGSSVGGGFCHECGALAAREDKFCRQCGTKLRK